MQNKKPNVYKIKVEGVEELWLTEVSSPPKKKPERSLTRGCWQCHANEDC